MSVWSNWSGKLQAQPSRLHFIRSEADAQALAQNANANGEHIRVAGAKHSHTPLVAHDGIIADSSGLAGVIKVDQKAMTAWIWAGTRIYALGRPLHDAGLALHNQGDIDQQSYAGATATGTHGTGLELKNLSSTVVSATIALASGDLVNCSADENHDLWEASRLHLGALGIVTRLQIQLRPAYRLQELAWTGDLDQALQQADAEACRHRHHEFFWYPQTDQAQGKSINITDDPAAYPLATEGHRCAWSYEVLPNHRPHKHTEMEYSVPLDQGPACMTAIRDLLTSKFTSIRWPVEYRTLAADDVWLSTAYLRDTVTISVHQAVEENDEPYFRACEEIFLQYGGLPHWGKVNYLSSAQLAKGHARWHDWWRIRDEIDPNGTFLNDYLRGLQ